MRRKRLVRFFLILYLTIIMSTSSSATLLGPFPVQGEIFDRNDQPYGTAHVYPRFVEIFDLQNNQVGKVGVLVKEGIAKLFLVGQDKNLSLVGYAAKGQIFDQNDTVVGTYFTTPTWSFVYTTNGKRAGKVKCIAWPRVCAVGVGGYLLDLFGGTNGKTP